jgi:O-antigen ligase
LSSTAKNPVGSFKTDDRYYIYQQGWQLIKDNPIRGAGVGSFAVVNPTVKWPHNMFIELWAELGLAAVLAVAASIISVLVGLFRMGWRSAETGGEQGLIYLLLGVFFFNLLAVQVSGNINDNRDFWGMLAISWMVIAGGVRGRDADADTL